MAATFSKEYRAGSRGAMATFWLLTAAVVGLDVVASLSLGWSMPWRLLEGVAAADLVLVAPLALRRYRRDARLPGMLEGAAALVTFTAFAGLLSYLVTATAAPLVDAQLAAADRALGFDHAAWQAALHRHATVARLLDAAYASGLFQLAAIVLLLGASGRASRLGEFLLAFAVATMLSIAVSAWAPAAGPWIFYGDGASSQLAALSHFEALRDGFMQAFPVAQPQGLISMPSMHAAAAVLFVFAVKDTRWARPVGLLNGLMLASTPMSGGHYLVDVIAGIALAAVVIAAGRWTAVEGRPRIPSILWMNLVRGLAR